MRKVICLALVLSVLAAANGVALHPEFRAAGSARQTVSGIGRMDTIGGTTWDRQVTGAEPRMICCDTAVGVCVGWSFSALRGGGNTDLNVRFNFLDRGRMAWNWIDSGNFMNSGANVFASRCLIGDLDVNPLTHCAFVGATLTEGQPTIARESLPGARGFEESDGPQNYLMPLIAVGRSGTLHTAFKSASLGSDFYYSGVDTTLVWSNLQLISPPFPDPGQGKYDISASRRSNKVSILWLQENRIPPGLDWAASSNGGLTWRVGDTIGLPPAFHPHSDTLPCPVDVFPWYDPDEDEDALHVVAAIVPILGDTTIVSPVEIWHWSELAGWTRIARAGCDPAHLQGNLGFDAIYAGRPTLGVDPLRHELVCVWEQFDSTNVEPSNGALRADIWACRGDSTGTHWGTPVRLTDPDNTSKRFPCVGDFTLGDTAVIAYEVDSVAGFADIEQGPWTNNPIVVRWVPVELLPFSGLTESPTPGARRMTLDVSPSPCYGRTNIRILESCDSGRYGSLPLQIFDRSGRLVRTFPIPHSAFSSPHCLVWDGNDEQGRKLPSGVYLIRLEGGTNSVEMKQVILLR